MTRKEPDSDFKKEMLEDSLEELLNVSFKYFIFLERHLSIYLIKLDIVYLDDAINDLKSCLKKDHSTNILVIFCLLVKYFSQTESEYFNILHRKEKNYTYMKYC